MTQLSTNQIGASPEKGSSHNLYILLLRVKFLEWPPIWRHTRSSNVLLFSLDLNLMYVLSRDSHGVDGPATQ